MDLRFAHMHKQLSHSIIRSFESLSRVICHSLIHRAFAWAIKCLTCQQALRFRFVRTLKSICSTVSVSPHAISHDGLTRCSSLKHPQRSLTLHAVRCALCALCAVCAVRCVRCACCVRCAYVADNNRCGFKLNDHHLSDDHAQRNSNTADVLAPLSHLQPMRHRASSHHPGGKHIPHLGAFDHDSRRRCARLHSRRWIYNRTFQFRASLENSRTRALLRSNANQSNANRKNADLFGYPIQRRNQRRVLHRSGPTSNLRKQSAVSDLSEIRRSGISAPVATRAKFRPFD
jgi:hypothetical protein